MKRIISVFLCIIMALSLCACEKKVTSITATYKGSQSSGTTLSSNNNGIEVTAYYKDGSSEVVEGWEISHPTTLEAEKTSTVEIRYKDCACDLYVDCTTLTEEHYKDMCSTYSYNEVSNNPYAFQDCYIKFIGKVLQVVDNGYSSTLRIGTKGYNNVYYVDYYGHSDNMILEDDYVTVFGTCNGIKTYTAVSGSSVSLPWVKSDYINGDIKNKALSIYEINNLSDEPSYLEYTTGKGSNTNSLVSGYITTAEWAVAYDNTQNYTDVLNNFYVPDGISPARFSKYASLFEHKDGYEWRGIHTTTQFSTNDVYQTVAYADYYSMQEYDDNADSSKGYTWNTFTLNYDGKVYSDCLMFDYGEFSNNYRVLDDYVFYRVPIGYDGCMFIYFNSQGYNVINGHFEDDKSLLDFLGPDPVIFRLR